jgi:AcrR family transcriptional regulator
VKDKPDGPEAGAETPKRADAQRNIDALLHAAKEVFATSGVDAPVREIAEKAGVGLGTLYRHFPQRSDLIVAIMRREIDACADAAQVLSKKHKPGDALARWMQRYVDFVATKRGLAAALHSGDAAYQALPVYFEQRFKPALRAMLDNAIASGEIRAEAEPDDLLRAVPGLCMFADGKDGLARARRMVALLVDGLRYGGS